MVKKKLQINKQSTISSSLHLISLLQVFFLTGLPLQFVSTIISQQNGSSNDNFIFLLWKNTDQQYVIYMTLCMQTFSTTVENTSLWTWWVNILVSKVIHLTLSSLIFEPKTLEPFLKVKTFSLQGVLGQIHICMNREEFQIP